MSRDEVLERLANATVELNETMKVIADVLEEIRVELQWGIRNDRVRLTSMATDPTAKDMRINEVDVLEQTITCSDSEAEHTLRNALALNWNPNLIRQDGGFTGQCPTCEEKATPVPLQPGRLF